MKHFLLTISFLIISLTAKTQTPTFKWAKQTGGAFNDVSFAIATDKSGNVYTTGYFYGTADFDPGSATYNLTSAGGPDIFISKLDAAGNFVWAKSMGSTLGDNAYSIETDTSGNVYITGYYNGTVDFDPSATGTFNLTSAGADDIFILKLNTTGNFVWAKSMGGNQADDGYSLACDDSANIYATGQFKGTADFDPGANVFNLTAAGNLDIFILKLDSSGNFVWAKDIGGALNDMAYVIKLDKTGNSFITGSFHGDVDFDPSATGTFMLNNVGTNDMYILKLNSSGNFVWAKAVSGTLGSVTGLGLDLDATGNIITTGPFQGTIDFNPGTGTANLLTAGIEDIFILKLDPSGNFVWVENMGGTAADARGQCVSTDANGNIYVTGSFTGTVDFDPSANLSNLSSVGNADIFIVKLDSLGNLKLSIPIGASSFDLGSGITVDASGNVYTTGYFSGSSDFDPGSGISNLVAAGSSDIFVEKLGQTGSGIHELSKKNIPYIFPNPTHGFVKIDCSDEKSISGIEIYNSIGDLIFKQTRLSRENIFDLSNQPNGIYFVKLIDNENSITSERILKTD